MEAIFLQGSGMIKLTIKHITLAWRWGHDFGSASGQVVLGSYCSLWGHCGPPPAQLPQQWGNCWQRTHSSNSDTNSRLHHPPWDFPGPQLQVGGAEGQNWG